LPASARFVFGTGPKSTAGYQSHPQTFCIEIKELRGDAENGRQRLQRPVCQVGFVLFFFDWGGKIALPEKGFESKRLIRFRIC
jgi:hypothetical protein